MENGSRFRREQRHRYGLGDFLFQIPARWIAHVRKEGVNADDRLRGILLVEFVGSLIPFLGNGEEARGGNGFEWIGRFGMEHAEADREIIAGVHQRESQGGADDETFDDDARGEHAVSITKVRGSCAERARTGVRAS